MDMAVKSFLAATCLVSRVETRQGAVIFLGSADVCTRTAQVRSQVSTIYLVFGATTSVSNALM